MFLFLHDHLVQLLNESLAQTRIYNDGISITGYTIRSNSYFELFDINMIVIICNFEIKRQTKLYQNFGSEVMEKSEAVINSVVRTYSYY
jgi:hypothetical protein